MRFFRLLMIGAALVGCGEADRRSGLVSIHELIVNPGEFDGKTVAFSGYFVYEFENVAVYESRERAKMVDSAASIWVDVSGADDELTKFSGEWIMIEGVFSTEYLGHDGLSRGVLLSPRLATPGQAY